MANNRKKTPAFSEENQVEVLNNEVTRETTKPKKKKIKYTVECIGKNKVWLRKDSHTVIMQVGSFDYRVGDTVEI